MSQKPVILADGIEGLFIKNKRFNTTLISCNMFLPLNEETVAANALLPFILTSCCKKYPSFTQLNYKLNKLYGARLDASAEKYGDYQLLKMSISVINDNFSLDDDSIVKQATQLLIELIFNPSIDSAGFLFEDVEREKRKAIEHIKSEISEKRIYAKNRLLEEMYKGETYGISKCGTIEQVKSITGISLLRAWEKMLSCAFIRFNVVGAEMPEGLFTEIKEKFSNISRRNITNCKVSKPTKATEKVNTITEKTDITQGKLVMGFSCDMCGNDNNTLPLLVMCDIFGGGPYSRLFSNVREKFSLCYYCSSAAVRLKGLLTVSSGVESKNCDKAQAEILNQLQIIKNGEFSDFEFESSIKSICDSFKGYEDSQSALDTWYTLKINNDYICSPDEMTEMITKITPSEVINVAKGVNLHTVFKLLPKEAAE